MKKTIRFLLLAVLPLSFSHATETAVWDTFNNTVTYSDSAAGIISYGDIMSLSLSKFNSDNAISAGAASGITYTLSKVILSIDGQIAGEFSYFNSQTSSRDVSSSALRSMTAFTLTANAIDAREYFAYTVPNMPITVDAGATVTRVFASEGSGGTTTITDALRLSDFTGNGTFVSSVSLQAEDTTTKQSGIFSGLTASGNASISVTYQYVPEPTSLALLGMGFAAILTRRRFKRSAR